MNKVGGTSLQEGWNERAWSCHLIFYLFVFYFKSIFIFTFIEKAMRLQDEKHLVPKWTGLMTIIGEDSPKFGSSYHFYIVLNSANNMNAIWGLKEFRYTCHSFLFACVFILFYFHFLGEDNCTFYFLIFIIYLYYYILYIKWNMEEKLYLSIFLKIFKIIYI